MIEAVSDGRLDFAPVGVPRGLPDHLRDRVKMIDISVEPMLLACAGTHRLATRKSVRLGDLADERFADFAPDWAIRLVNDRAFADIRLARRVAFEVNDVDALLDLVGLDLAIAIVPRSVRGRAAKLRYVRLSDPAPVWRIGVAVPAGRPPSPAALALFQAMVPGVLWPSPPAGRLNIGRGTPT